MKYTPRILSGLVLLLALPTLAPAATIAPPDVAGLEVAANGTFSFDRILVHAGHFGPEWEASVQTKTKPEAGYPKLENGAWVTRIGMQPRHVVDRIMLTETLKRIDEHAFQLDMEAVHSTGVATREMFLQLTVPVEVGAGKSLYIDGAEIPLPAEYDSMSLHSANGAVRRTLVLPGATGTVTVEGVFSLLVQDNRRWKSDSFSIRLRFSPGGATLTKANLSATFRATPYRSTPIPLRDVVNFGFRDDVSGDGRGGWTDQGPANDLRMLPSGSLTASGVVFEILDENANNGRGAIVLGKADQSFLPKSVDIPIPSSLAGEAKDWRNIYLLHASGWTPKADVSLGRVILRHTDGSESTTEIISDRDIGNWWSPRALPNGSVGWTDVNPMGNIGLYVSRIPTGGKPVKAIRLESDGTGMWMVAGISAADGDLVPFSLEVPWVAAEGPDWGALKDFTLDIEEGSAFDFSSLLDAPAGKYGHITVTPEGTFAFAERPDERARFWGVNLCFSANSIPHETADILADRLARSGYNTVRFHHFEREFQIRDNATSTIINAEKIDNLDYLFAALKKRGIYLNIDLYVNRVLAPEELVRIGFDPNESGSFQSRFKSAIPVSDAAFEIWAEYARKFLTRRNPYTGMTWAEDPALIGICLVNEDSPNRSHVENDRVLAPMWRKAFEAWKQKPENAIREGETEAIYFNRFVYDTQAAAQERMMQFVRDLGVKAPLSGSNHHMEQALTFVRDHFDYVDNHQYWDHPRFPKTSWSHPIEFRQASSTRLAARMPRSLMSTRIAGKPFAVTEFRFVRPSRYRAEGGVLMPAYAGLQDWDALYNFEYSGSRRGVEDPRIDGIFPMTSDPIGLISDRVGSAIFLRGDVEPGKNLIGFAVQPNTAFQSMTKPFPEEFSRLGLVTRIGSSIAAPEALAEEDEIAAVIVDPAGYNTVTKNPIIFPADETLATTLQQKGILPADSISMDETVFRSDTGQIELQTDAGVIKLVTPRSEHFVLQPKSELSGESVSVRNGDTFGTVAVVAVDGRPIAESQRLLVTHLTNSLPTGIRFGDANMQVEEVRGTLPHLIERGAAEITLNLDNGSEYQAWAISPSGARLREVPLKKTTAGWVLQANTVTKAGTQLAYEIARK